MAFKEQITAAGDGLLIQAPGKINLSLLVAGKRDDGFHDIETLMAKVSFYDEILIQPGAKAGIELICQGPYWAPSGNENLVYKACQMFLESCGLQTDVKITLTKNIPAGSGLGSASSDAASTLLGVNKFLTLKVQHSELNQMAATLGSDVAFFLNGPLAFCTGKGEKIKKIAQKLNFFALLILPDISVSTEKVYANYKHNLSLYKKLNSEIKRHLEKNRFDLVLKMCANMLESSCFGLHKELDDLKGRIESLGCGPLCLSGSGSAMFCLFDSADEEKAKGYQRKIKREFGCTSIIVNNNRW
jgi:4-diphosphocytidyl-2-C-methyl-D-erythritol kinase